MTELIPWPEKPAFTMVPTWTDMGGNVVVQEPYFDETNYERLRAEAALARLRLAVDALKQAKDDFDDGVSPVLAEVTIDEALQAIGEIPA